jgi:hypothetical protein
MNGINKSKNHEISQHFFFLEKRKPVLKEKQKTSFGKALLSKKRLLVKIRVIWRL